LLLGATLSLRPASIQELYAFSSGVANANPNGLTLVSSGILYGTTANGGAGYGTVFRLTPNGQLTTIATISRQPSQLTLAADARHQWLESDPQRGAQWRLSDPSGDEHCRSVVLAD
jgi:uncharacterized repeat protein (TIGR03803 family)